MAANPPITSIPAQLAQPSEHILRYLTSIHPYVYHHAQEGTNKLESTSRLTKKGHGLHSDRNVTNLDSVAQKMGLPRRGKIDMRTPEDERWQGESDTESARRRLNRKLRRRENAAIRKPLAVGVASPYPLGGARRCSKQSRHEYFVEEEEDQERLECRPKENERRMKIKQTKMPGWLEEYRYKHVTEGRLTLPPGRKAGFLTKGKASKPVRPSAQSHRESAAFDEQMFLKRSRRQSSIDSEDLGWRKRQMNTARPLPAQQSGRLLEGHSRRSGISYLSRTPEGDGRPRLQRRERRYHPGELPPLGIQGSPSWPTQGDTNSHVRSRGDGLRAASLKAESLDESSRSIF
ncbi:hypothetical protein BCR39DRAFT_591722 [Naematelia encephala]|uniref:Uncharacterized protein n=1 Tax=Naematelia encephala TaxID=71784 RepID=A0A1Y2AG24_9TREE|nr:hypothetical protein BCR39DRAFT_591722 [Naematelia encephala]